MTRTVNEAEMLLISSVLRAGVTLLSDPNVNLSDDQLARVLASMTKVARKGLKTRAPVRPKVRRGLGFDLEY